MKRTMLALMTASAMAMTVPVLGQSSTTTADASKDMTITGCLVKNKSGGFWLTESRTGASAAASSASTTAPNQASTTTGSSSSTTADRNAATTTGTAGRATASTTADKDARQASAHGMWNLQHGHDLDQYLNQTIQVTGKAKDSTSGDEVKGTTGREMDARDFDVKSVRRVAASCS